MKTEKKILSLVNHGFKTSTLLKLNENQINLLYNKLQEQITTTQLPPMKVTKIPPANAKSTGANIGNIDVSMDASGNVIVKGPVNSGKSEIKNKNKVISEPEITEDETDDIDSKNALGKDALQSYTGQELPHDANDMSPDGMDDDSDNDRNMMGMSEEMDFLMGVDEEITEKFESKAQQGLFWARCNKCSDKNCKWCKMAKEFSKSTSKKQYEKMPEKKHPEKTVKYKKKETKENYMDMVSKGITNNFRLKLDDVQPKVSFDNMSEEKLEKNIMKLVEKHILPKMSKKDLISFISEQGTKEKEKERTKEKEKEKSPDTPYKPKPGPKPNPKASKKEVDEQETAPVKTPPKTKPTTKPNKPGTPYSPKPGPKPAPKAGKNELPNWLSFSKIGINLK